MHNLLFLQTVITFNPLSSYKFFKYNLFKIYESCLSSLKMVLFKIAATFTDKQNMQIFVVGICFMRFEITMNIFIYFFSGSRPSQAKYIHIFISQYLNTFSCLMILKFLFVCS